ncbi:MAG: amidohydrolase family protein [Dehalococcoidia bacterium]
MSGVRASPRGQILHLRGSTLADPEGGFRKGDLLLERGVIRAMHRVPPDTLRQAQTVDLGGLHVAPGFIDIHAHVLNRPEGESNRLPPDRVGVRQGVACVVDAGSAGAGTIEGFVELREHQDTSLFALINIGSPGAPGTGRGAGHSSRPEWVSLEATVSAVERHREFVRGIKVQASASHTGTYGLTAVALARKAADLTGLPLMMHVGNAPPVLDEALDYLREGDILTHAFHGKVGGALTFEGKLLPALEEAVRRGVLIDVGHGRSSFAFATAERVLDQGLPVHSISTDLHHGNVDRYVVSLARTMTKMVSLGITLEEAIRAVTATPARALRLERDGFGSMATGQPANLTVFRLRSDPLEVEDSHGELRRVERWIEPTAVYVGGVRYEVDAPL